MRSSLFVLLVATCFASIGAKPTFRPTTTTTTTTIKPTAVPTTTTTAPPNATFAPPACFNDPFVKYANGSNSTYECWLTQFPPSSGGDDLNSAKDQCSQTQSLPCFQLGAPNRPEPAGLALRNGNAINVGNDPEAVWRLMFHANGNKALYYYAENQCLDAYLEGGVLKVHGWECGGWNTNQYWKYVAGNWGSTQLVEHATHKGYCLQLNRELAVRQVELQPCRWNVYEQQLVLNM
ncbi:Aste57867_13467 [Aphanomyces stellatus]|uniref:Aste57867_13467 protein n=1 Tax=Aphanomyces stellatus TaxID=120398 RepID=A0A485KY56_9STRA|nr:hypothetical protein As57867_013417 [Aphanomyces stellatus]VFT90305.1 Aste57867_13467 [Aphanomyces stellatus]